MTCYFNISIYTWDMSRRLVFFFQETTCRFWISLSNVTLNSWSSLLLCSCLYNCVCSFPWAATGGMDNKLIIWDLQHSLPRSTCDHEVCGSFICIIYSLLYFMLIAYHHHILPSLSIYIYIYILKNNFHQLVCFHPMSIVGCHTLHFYSLQLF